MESTLPKVFKTVALNTNFFFGLMGMHLLQSTSSSSGTNANHEFELFKGHLCGLVMTQQFFFRKSIFSCCLRFGGHQNFSCGTFNWLTVCSKFVFNLLICWLKTFILVCVSHDCQQSWSIVCYLYRVMSTCGCKLHMSLNKKKITFWLYNLISDHLPQTYSIKQSINQSVNQSINQSVNPSINQSIHQSVNPSISQSINQSISPSISQSINQSIHPSISQPTNLNTITIPV